MYPATMSQLPSLGFIEPLEARIAPAVILLGPAAQGGIEYSDAHFVKTSANAADPISAVVGAGDAAHPTYYLRLTAGSKVSVFENNSAFVPLIGGPTAKGTVGNIVAFFVDKHDANGNAVADGIAQPDELTGLALGRNAGVTVSGSVDGDIVSNLNALSTDPAQWRLGGTGEAAGTAHDLLLNPITSLSVAGDVHGSIVSGGRISNVSVTGGVNQILAGTAANNFAFDFDTKGANNPDGGDTLTVNTPATGVAGVSILQVSLGKLGSLTSPVGLIQSGDGGAGAAGGSIGGIAVLADTDGLTIKTGDGGAGGAGHFARGGNGGAISGVLVRGLPANTLDTSMTDAITFTTGNGGHSAGGFGGGNGGGMSNIFVGFSVDPSTHLLKRSVTPLNDSVLVKAGNGGGGGVGGKGGTLIGIHLASKPTGSGNDLSVIAGDGGASDVALPRGAKAGAGGSLVSVDARNLNSDFGSMNILHAGAGGVANGTAAGGAGGTILSAQSLGFDVDARAGDGSAGSVLGGAGGALRGLTVEELADSSAQGVRAHHVVAAAGKGGNSTNGPGGMGGLLAALTIDNADLSTAGAGVFINQGTAANGGTGGTIGGAGGAVQNVRLTGIGVPSSTSAATALVLRGGDGATGGFRGGAGGGIAGVNLNTRSENANNVSVTVHAGNGGSATGANGVGAAGGSILSFSSDTQRLASDGSFVFDPVNPTIRVFNTATADIRAGIGGDGSGQLPGGAGGSISLAHVEADGSVLVLAGKGGSGGATGVTGNGGALAFVYSQVNNSTASLEAGDAGTAGAKAGAGGNVLSAQVRSSGAMNVVAGNGSNGGAGGTIRSLFFSAPDGTASTGNITIKAGNGSGGLLAGAGGSVLGANGFVSNAGVTLIQGGTGGATAARAAAGGSVANIGIYGGGAAAGVLRIEAGDATASAGAALGGAGGGVADVKVFALDPAATLRHIEAGNGGDTSLSNGHGGRGGSITNVFVNGDIGVRNGLGFGADAMGGLFAGAGGINTTVAGRTPNTLDALDGAAGSVTQVTADAIAAIVAGHPMTGDVITKRNVVTNVSGIILNGSVAALADPNGQYTNFGTANLVGGNHLASPNTTPMANTFEVTEFTDSGAGNAGTFGIGDATTASTDGFIAAFRLSGLRNFTPEALLTVDASGNSLFIDSKNNQP